MVWFLGVIWEAWNPKDMLLETVQIVCSAFSLIIKVRTLKFLFSFYMFEEKTASLLQMLNSVLKVVLLFIYFVDL